MWRASSDVRVSALHVEPLGLADGVCGGVGDFFVTVMAYRCSCTPTLNDEAVFHEVGCAMNLADRLEAMEWILKEILTEVRLLKRRTK